MAVRSRARRIGLASLAVFVVVLSLLSGLAFWALDPASLKPRLIEAVRRATGRTLAINGAIGIKFALVPTVSITDVTLSNPPGFSRPDMATVGRVELGLALFPLLRHQFQLEHVALVRPDVLFETDAAGHPNWIFARPEPPAAGVLTTPAPESRPAPEPTASPPAPPSQGTPVVPAKRGFSVSFKDARVVDGRAGWIDGKSGRRYDFGTPRLDLTADQGGPVQLAGTVTYSGRTIDLTAHALPTESMDGPPGSGPWPVAAKLVSGGAMVTVDGKIAQPMQGRGYVLAIDANFPDPSVLADFLPRVPWVGVHALTAHAEVNDSGGPIPNVTTLRVEAGTIDLDRFVHGARLENVSLTGKADAPLRIAARANIDGLDSGISGSLGDLGWLTRGASGPVAVDLEWNAASARASVKGTVQAPSRFTGVALDVAVNAPDPSLVMRDAPPQLKALAFQTRLSDAPGPVPFQLTSTAGDLTGELSVSRLPQIPGMKAQGDTGARISVNGQVSSRRLNLDILREVRGVDATSAGTGTTRPGTTGTGMPGSGMPGSGTPGSGTPAMETPGTGTAPGAGPVGGMGSPGGTTGTTASGGPIVVANAANQRLIPDMKLPFDRLREVNGAIRFNFGHVLFDGTDVRRIDGVASISDGTLRVDPFTISAPNQRMNGSLVADGGKTPPAVHLAIDAPGLALRPLLTALGLPPVATGSAEVHADLSGTGDTPHAIAGSLNGWAEVAVDGGVLDARMMNSWLGPFQALHIGGGDMTDLRCFAMRADAKAGIVTFNPLDLSTAALIVEGGGDIDLGHETLALRLRPRTKIGGTGIALPLRVTGPMRDPSARIDISSKGPGGGMLAGLLLGGKDVMGAAGGGDPCPAALAQARQGAGIDAAPGESHRAGQGAATGAGSGADVPLSPMPAPAPGTQP